MCSTLGLTALIGFPIALGLIITFFVVRADVRANDRIFERKQW